MRSGQNDDFKGLGFPQALFLLSLFLSRKINMPYYEEFRERSLLC